MEGLESDYLPFGEDVFYTIAPDPLHRRSHELRAMNRLTGTVRLLGRFDATFVNGFTISPDGKNLLLGRFDFSSDLILVENFH